MRERPDLDIKNATEDELKLVQAALLLSGNHYRFMNWEGAAREMAKIALVLQKPVYLPDKGDWACCSLERGKPAFWYARPFEGTINPWSHSVPEEYQ